MHELALAEAVLDVVLAHAVGRGVARIELTVGRLRQVVPGALAFAVELAARGTPAEGAALALTVAPAAGRCGECGGETALDRFPFACAACGSLAVVPTAGAELRIDAIEVDDDPQSKEATP
jgi:hydrogenase nickel incorporation protein HypA/HybF